MPRKPKVPETLAQIVARGDRRQTLEALRVVLAESIETADAHQRAALARQLRDTVRELAGMDASSSTVELLRNRVLVLERELAEAKSAKVSRLEELRASRAARHSGAAAVAPAAKRGQPRRSNGSHRVG